MPNLGNQYCYISQFEIDKVAEKNSWHIRFKDLKPKARDRFIQGLKRDSSVMTLRTQKDSDLLEVVTDLNPIMINIGWRGSFSNSSFYRWKEQILSSAVFNSMCRTNPRAMSIYARKEMFDTPRAALEATHQTFMCTECRTEHSMQEMDYWATNVCRSCVSNRNNYAKS